MVKEFWMNLPVKDLAKSREFFTKLGFSFRNHPGMENNLASLIVGEKGGIVNMFPEATFKSFTKNALTDVSQSTEALFSFDAESREEVDQITRKAKEAGGTVYAEPGDNQGWMYGSGFTDLDGHRWNILYMDMSKMPR